MDAKEIKKINSKLANVKFWKRDLAFKLGVKPPQLSYWLEQANKGKCVIPDKYVERIYKFVKDRA